MLNFCVSWKSLLLNMKTQKMHSHQVSPPFHQRIGLNLSVLLSPFNERLFFVLAAGSPAR